MEVLRAVTGSLRFLKMFGLPSIKWNNVWVWLRHFKDVRDPNSKCGHKISMCRTYELSQSSLTAEMNVALQTMPKLRKLQKYLSKGLLGVSGNTLLSDKFKEIVMWHEKVNKFLFACSTCVCVCVCLHLKGSEYSYLSCSSHCFVAVCQMS